MKKLILTAAAAVAAFAGANAQATDQSSYAITVPQVLSINTTPVDASFTHTLTENEMTGGKALPGVNWTVKSNVMWKAAASWSVTGPTATGAQSVLVAPSLTAFRNALTFSIDGGAPQALPASPTSINPLPGYNSQNPTAATGKVINVAANLAPINYTCMPGVYTATTTVTVSAL